MEYKVYKTQIVNPKINSDEWEKAELGTLTQSLWGGYCPCPNTTFKMLYGDEGISVLMHTDETHLQAEAKKYDDPVYQDSCMEFFFKPDPYDKHYINFEVNPRGVMHIGIGTDRNDRVLIADDREKKLIFIFLIFLIRLDFWGKLMFDRVTYVIGKKAITLINNECNKLPFETLSKKGNV